MAFNTRSIWMNTADNTCPRAGRYWLTLQHEDLIAAYEARYPEYYLPDPAGAAQTVSGQTGENG